MTEGVSVLVLLVFPCGSAVWQWSCPSSNFSVAELPGFSTNGLSFLVWCSRVPNKTEKQKRKRKKNQVYILD